MNIFTVKMNGLNPVLGVAHRCCSLLYIWIHPSLVMARVLLPGPGETSEKLGVRSLRHPVDCASYERLFE